jgi:hypothetical protein
LSEKNTLNQATLLLRHFNKFNLNILKSKRLKVNLEKTNYMLVSRYQKAGHSIRIGNSSFEDLEEFKYLGTTITDLVYARRD